MTDLRITTDQAVALLELIDREEKLYADGPLAPARVHRLREVRTVVEMKLDAQERVLEDHHAEQAYEAQQEA